MSDEKHIDDIRRIDEGDYVTLETNESEKIEAECVDYRRDNARDPNIIRENHLWEFETDDGVPVVAAITDGLKEREGMADFPRHKQLFDQKNEKAIGYISEVEFQ